MTQGVGSTTSGAQRLRVQTSSQANAITTSLKGPLRIVPRGPRRLAG